jgi:hypothetical protein
MDGQLQVATAPGDGVLLESRLQQPANRQIVDDAVAAVWGSGSGWRLARGDAKKIAPPAAAATAAAPAAGITEIPQVQAVLDIFGGRVEKIEEHGRSREE